ncbi:hypothetical protein HKD37_02G004904 [Glycine soja]
MHIFQENDRSYPAQVVAAQIRTLLYKHEGCKGFVPSPGLKIKYNLHVLKRDVVTSARSLLGQNKFERCFTRPSTFLIQTHIYVVISVSSAFPNSSQRFTKPLQRLCFSMATAPKETSAPGSPSVPSSPSSTKAPSNQERPEFNIQPIQMIPGPAPVPEKLVPKRQQGVKISENPSLATSSKEVDTEMDKKIRSIVSNILKNASIPDADKDVPTSSTPNAEVLSSSSKEESTEEEDQATEETPAPRAPEPAPGDLIDLEEVESDEEPIANKLAPGIAERLQSRKGKTPITRSGRIKTMAQKKSTPITPTTSRWSKVAIPSKKRKEISSSDSDDDVELDVPDIKRAKKSGKKVPGNVPDAPLDNISFHSIGNVERWKFVYQRRLALERELGRDALDCKEIMDLIKAAGLLKTVTKLGDCYESLVREFIVNIPSDITNRKSDEYQKVFVRGKCVRFSPAVINKYLGRPTEGVVDIAVSEHQIAKEITAKQVQHWPKKGKLSAGKLSVKYAILHRIGAANWVPTNHTSTVATGLGKFLYAVGTKSKFNFGNYIFDQTVKHSESFAVKLPIAFPTVLCGIMLSQHPNISNYTDSVKKRESALSLHYKLFEGTHVPDIVSTSGKAAASGAVSKDALIAELKDTCKVLEATIKATTEKKMELERLIKRLSDSGIDDDWVKDAREDPRVLMSLRSSFRAKNFVRFSSSPFIHLLLPPSSYTWPPMMVSFFYTHLFLEVASPLSLPSPFHFHSSSKKQRNPLMKKFLGLQAPHRATSCARSLLGQNKFDRCFTRPSTFLIQTHIYVVISVSSAFPNSSQKFTKPFQRLCFSMATAPKETSTPGSPSVPSSPSSTKAPSRQERPEFTIQPIQMIPGSAPVPEKLVPKRQQGMKISENPSLATSPREVDTEMDKKIRSIVSSILKNASVPDADTDVPTSSTPNVSVPDADKDVPTSSTPNDEVLSSSSKERSTKEEDQATEETPAPRAPEPAPGDLIDLEEVESDEEPIANKLAPGIAERLQSRKGKTPITRSGRIKTMAQKKSTPITPTTSRWSKVAIPSKKRKEISSSDSDDDVELDVPDIKRAKKSGKKVPGNVPDAPLDNISFHSIGNVERWKFVYQRRLALERELGRDALDCKEIMDLIKAAGLLKTVTKLGDCYESLVREFIVNIPSDITNRKSDEYQKVFVRGKCVRFSPAVINKYLGRPTEGVVDITVSEHQIAKEITAKQVQHWPKKGKLSAGKLSVKYAILHRIGAANWVPTNHTSTVATGLGKFLYAVGTKSKFNFGNYIFYQTVKHSESFAVKLPIAFPTVLCGIMLSQHPNILNYTDSVKKRESALSLHYKLFEGTHVPDIVSTSGKAAASGAVSKDALIAELKDTCKVLEATIKATTEKKMELERLIKRLSDSGIDDEEKDSSNKIVKKENHFATKCDIKRALLLKQSFYLLLSRETSLSTAIPLELEVIPQIKELLEEGLVRKSLNLCALLVPKIGIMRHQIPMIGGVEERIPEFQEPLDLSDISSLSSFSIPLPFIFQEANESIDEEDPRPTSSTWSYITYLLNKMPTYHNQKFKRGLRRRSTFI